MTDCLNELSFVETSTLLNYYGFELKGGSPNQLVEQWQRAYSTYWVRLAVIESLYQGRYKAISVEHILDLWSRKGHPAFHFTHDFERLVCYKLPESMELPSSTQSLVAQERSKLSLKAIPPKLPATLTPLHQFFPEMQQPSAIEERKSAATTEIVGTESGLEPILSVEEELKDEASEGAAIADKIAPEPEPVSSPQPNLRAFDTAWPSGKTIRGFIPRLDESELYHKLRSVVHQELAAKMGG